MILLLRTLDYIFIEADWKVQSAQVFPHYDVKAVFGATSAEQPMEIISSTGDAQVIEGMQFGASFGKVITHSGPTPHWPSDHFMVVVALEI